MGLKKVTMAKTFSIEDLIDYEVERRLKRKAESGGDNISLNEIFKLIKMLIQLQREAQKHQQPQTPHTQTPQKQLNAENVVKSIEEAITMILNTYGDIPLSKVLDLLRQNREAVKSIIEQKLRSVQNGG